MFILPEAKLTAELKLQLQTLPVVVYRTTTDYDGATLNQKTFPWLDRVIRYGSAGF